MNDLMRGGREGLKDAICLILGILILLIVIMLASGCAVSDPLRWGMSPAQVHDRWGYPSRVNRSQGQGWRREQHVFYVWGKHWYAYFEDGKLTGIQQ